MATRSDKRPMPTTTNPDQAIKNRGVKVSFNGETIDADELVFEQTGEAIGRYGLTDGTEIEFRQEVTAIFRLIGKTKEDGSPIYLVSGGAKVKTTSPGQ